MKRIAKNRAARLDRPTNIIVCGVGGQGILLASDIVCYAAFAEGLDVKKSEIHGMAQRGGSVITHVRFGTKVHSPLIEIGAADFILAFEKLEALRYAHFAAGNCVFVVNDRELAPMTVLTGGAVYPENIESRLAAFGKVYMVDAGRIAAAAGNVRLANTVLIAGLANFLAFRDASWAAAIEKCVKPEYAAMNSEAFNRGRAAVAKT